MSFAFKQLVWHNSNGEVMKKQRWSTVMPTQFTVLFVTTKSVLWPVDYQTAVTLHLEILNFCAVAFKGQLILKF